MSGGETITATFTVTNTGKVAGADVPQVYLIDAPGGRRMRLLGFERVDLKPGESRTVTVQPIRGCSRGSMARTASADGESTKVRIRSRSASPPANSC